MFKSKELHGLNGYLFQVHIERVKRIAHFLSCSPQIILHAVLAGSRTISKILGGCI